jgi:hypothetical protein
VWSTKKEDIMMARSRTLSTALVSAVAAVAIAAALVTPLASHSTEAARPAPASPLTAEEAISQIEGEDGVLRFEVAEDASRFVWAGDPVLTDGLPADSTPYVTQGYLYPVGTLTNGNGVLADGSPEFPDKVLGQWSCWGWRLSGSDHAQSPSWLTSHLFNFGDQWGEATLLSEGYSIDDLGVPLNRVVIGGTGPYAGASGVQAETNLGFNATDGMNFSYEIDLAD